MRVKEVEINGYKFEIESFKGLEATSLGYRLLKLGGGAISRFLASNKFSEDDSKEVTAKDLKGFNFSVAVDYFFENLSESDFEKLVVKVLSKVKYEKGEYLKIMDREPFNGDFEITLKLLYESLEFNFGFFSKILTNFTMK